MNTLLLLLLDSRSPAGAHNHSGGMEPAVAAGLVRDFADVEAFCRSRLATAGRVAAAFAGAACALSAQPLDSGEWQRLDAEFEARTPSEAARAASRQLGRGLRRMVRAMTSSFDPPSLHQPLVLGAAVALAGGPPDLAARAAALGAAAGPASAAVRLLGLDPFAVHSLLSRLAAEIDRGVVPASGSGTGSPAALPADSAPALDLLADFHLTSEVRLFAS